MKISIQVKISLLILFTMVFSTIIVLLLTVNKQREDLLSETETTLSTTTEQLNITIRNIMISGEAPIAVSTLKQLKDISTFKEIDIYRTNGDRAFSDDKTLTMVNERIRQMGGQEIELTERIEKKSFSNEEFKKVLERNTPITISSDKNKEIEYYYPILNYPNYGCTSCHGDKPFIRGIAHITISTANAYETISNNQIILTTFFTIAGIMTVIILILFLRGLVVKPLLEIGKIVTAVGDGNFEARVKLNNKDELGLLGQKINIMIKNVEERFKLSKYVSKSTETHIKDSKSYIDGEKKTVTVLFSDIRGFTSYSEKNDPQTVIKTLNNILQIQTDIVEKYSGDVDKFVGDELMAVFTDEYKAALCACEMIEQVAQLKTSLHIGIGINYGEVIIGNIGSKSRSEYAIIGDTVNLGSRLCSLAKPDTIIISDKLYSKVRMKVKAVLIPEQKIKGKEQKLNLYAVTHIVDENGQWKEIQKEERIISHYNL